MGIENLDLYQIFETLYQIDSLEIIDLRYCYVSEMPENTYKLNHLIELWLNENYLSDEERKKTKDMLPNTFIVFNNSRITDYMKLILLILVILLTSNIVSLAPVVRSLQLRTK